MVFVKVRETYDLHTVKNKMSVIGIHTPREGIIKANFPGLLLQCKSYRPVSCDVRMACASMLPLDPQGIGTAEGDVAPEDVFNPILFKAMSNFGMSQIEDYVHLMNTGINGPTIDADFDGITADDFNVYYGLLSQAGQWKHANPQQGLSMSGLRPLVYEVVSNIGTNGQGVAADGTAHELPNVQFRGSAKPMPWLECTRIHTTEGQIPPKYPTGFDALTDSGNIPNVQVDVPAPVIFTGLIIVPPSRLHQLFYRLVCEWTLEFSSIRPISEITSWTGLANEGLRTHFMSYSFESSKLSEKTGLIDTVEGMDIKKVM